MNWIDKLKVLKLTPLRDGRFAPLSEDELVNIERGIGKRLPDGYRSFLSRYGASDFEGYCVSPTNGGGVAPGSFFGRDLEHAIDEFRERLPYLVIPINDDGAGNLVCISLRDESYGAIFFQSHSIGIGDAEEDLDIARCATMCTLAADFQSFICGLEIE